MENIGVIEVQEDFQFTTSQGGRRLCLELEKQGKTFNSRPHKEVDRLIQVLLHQSDLSIHDLTRRSTIDRALCINVMLPFNSRPHKEVDTRQSISSALNVLFQFTTSQGGRPLITPRLTL